MTVTVAQILKQLTGKVGNRHSKHNQDHQDHKRDIQGAIIVLHKAFSTPGIMENCPFAVMNFEDLPEPSFADVVFEAGQDTTSDAED